MLIIYHESEDESSNLMIALDVGMLRKLLFTHHYLYRGLVIFHVFSTC